jgi:signal transduction histidine kinase
MNPVETENLTDLLRQQESLRQIIESISSELELRPLLTRIVRHACELIGADNGTIGLVDPARNVVRTEAAYRMPEDELGAEMGPGVGLAGQVLLSREPVILQRYGEVERPTQTGLLENPVIGMPIFWRDRMIGFFGLGSPVSGQFTERDVQSLSLFAKHAAIAIENARLFAGMHNSLAEMTLLYRTSRRISTAIDMDEVIGAYLEQVAARGRYACTIALYETDAAGHKTAVVVRGRWAPGEGMSLHEIHVPYTHDALDPPLDAGQTVMFSDVHADARASEALRALQRESGRPALAMVPLIVLGQRIGLVILSYPEIHVWQEADLRPYQVTAAQLATAIDSRRQARLLAERGQQFAVLEERQRLARELHDSVTQLLFSMTLIGQSIGAAYRRDVSEGEQRLARMLELSKQAHTEMRALLFELRPPDSQTIATSTASGMLAQVRRFGLSVALRNHLTGLASETVQVELNAEGYVPQSPEREETLFRIAQEALNNSVKHAKARHLRLRLTCEAGDACLLICDDGAGFAPQKLSPRAAGQSGGMGLTIMRERAEAHGGTLEITSAPGQGTTIAVRLPESEERL